MGSRKGLQRKRTRCKLNPCEAYADVYSHSHRRVKITWMTVLTRHAFTLSARFAFLNSSMWDFQLTTVKRSYLAKSIPNIKYTNRPVSKQLSLTNSLCVLRRVDVSKRSHARGLDSATCSERWAHGKGSIRKQFVIVCNSHTRELTCWGGVASHVISKGNLTVPRVYATTLAAIFQLFIMHNSEMTRDTCSVWEATDEIYQFDGSQTALPRTRKECNGTWSSHLGGVMFQKA